MYPDSPFHGYKFALRLPSPCWLPPFIVNVDGHTGDELLQRIVLDGIDIQFSADTVLQPFLISLMSSQVARWRYRIIERSVSALTTHLDFYWLRNGINIGAAIYIRSGECLEWSFLKIILQSLLARFSCLSQMRFCQATFQTPADLLPSPFLATLAEEILRP
jgi:hypothetical protein